MSTLSHLTDAELSHIADVSPFCDDYNEAALMEQHRRRETRDPGYRAVGRERRIASLTAAILNCNAEHVEFTDKAIRRTVQGETELAEIFTSRATAAMSRATQLSDERAALTTERAGLSIPVLEPITAAVVQLNPAMWPNLPCDVEAAE